MNFLIFINSLSCGGAERVAVELANHWAEKDWHVTIVTLASRELDFYPLHPSAQRIALESDGDSENTLCAIVNNLRNVMVLRRVLQDLKPDISLAMMPTANILLAMVTLGNPRLVTLGSERIHPLNLLSGDRGRVCDEVGTADYRPWSLSLTRVVPGYSNTPRHERLWSFLMQQSIPCLLNPYGERSINSLPMGARCCCLWED